MVARLVSTGSIFFLKACCIFQIPCREFAQNVARCGLRNARANARFFTERFRKRLRKARAYAITVAPAFL